MSEKQSYNPEATSEYHETHEHNNKPEKTSEIKHAKLEAEQSKNLEQARSEIAKNTSEKDSVREKISETAKSETGEFKGPVSGDLKKISLKRELKQIRRHLPKIDQLGSKVIHQPTIKIISETSAKTITRPSGLLGGGIAAFSGSGLYYYFSRHIGVKYNYLLFVLFFVGGFAVGLLIELVIWSSKHRNKSAT
jgi:hypothetical protein